MFLEGRQVRVRGVHDGGDLLAIAVVLGPQVCLQEVERRVAVDEVLQELAGDRVPRGLDDAGLRLAGMPGLVAALERLGAGGVGREHRSSAGARPAVVESVRRGHLRGGQAIAGLTGLALQDAWIEAAGFLVADERPAGGALLQRPVLQQLQRGQVEVGAGLGQGLLDVGPPAGGQGVVVGRGAGDDAVEVVGEPLRFHQRLAPAGRAADEIGQLRTAALLGGDQRLGRIGGFLQRARREVRDLLGVPQRPDRGATVADVAVVSACRGIASLGARLDGSRGYGAGQAAVADLDILAVPRPAHRDHHLDADLGVRGRPAGHRDQAGLHPRLQPFGLGRRHLSVRQGGAREVGAGGLSPRQGRSGERQRGPRRDQERLHFMSPQALAGA